MIGRPKHRTAKEHRIKSSGLLESSWQGREVKHGLEISVTQAGRQRRQVLSVNMCLPGLHLVPRRELFADGMTSQACTQVLLPHLTAHPHVPLSGTGSGCPLSLLGGQGTLLPLPGKVSLAQNGSLQLPPASPSSPTPKLSCSGVHCRAVLCLSCSQLSEVIYICSAHAHPL